MNFTITDLEGNILRTGSCPDDEVMLQAQPGELVQPGSALPETEAPSLDSVKLARRAFIKSIRDAAITMPKLTSVGQFDADMKAQVNLGNVISLTRIAAARGYPAEANFTLANNDRVTLTLDQLETAALEIGAHVQGLYDTADVLFRQIDQALTTEGALAVVWPP